MKGDNEDDKKKGEWINVGRQVRTKVNKNKYNFLEDAECNFLTLTFSVKTRIKLPQEQDDRSRKKT